MTNFSFRKTYKKAILIVVTARNKKELQSKRSRIGSVIEKGF